MATHPFPAAALKSSRSVPAREQVDMRCLSSSVCSLDPGKKRVLPGPGDESIREARDGHRIHSGQGDAEEAGASPLVQKARLAMRVP